MHHLMRRVLVRHLLLLVALTVLLVLLLIPAIATVLLAMLVPLDVFFELRDLRLVVAGFRLEFGYLTAVPSNPRVFVVDALEDAGFVAGGGRLAVPAVTVVIAVDVVGVTAVVRVATVTVTTATVAVTAAVADHRAVRAVAITAPVGAAVPVRRRVTVTVVGREG